MKASLACIAVVALLIAAAEAHPQRGSGGRRPPNGGRPAGGRGGDRPGILIKGGPQLSQATKDKITALAAAVNNATLTTELTNSMNSNNVSALMMSLLQVAAGNVGGSQTEWDTAQAIMIEIADSMAPGPKNGGGPDDNDGSSEEAGSSGGRPPRPGRPGGFPGGRPGGPPALGMMSPLMLHPGLIPTAVAMEKLKTYLASSVATQAQKDIGATLKTAVDTWKATTQAAMLAAMTTGSKPDLSEQFKRDTVMAEAVRTAANALKASEPSFTALYDSIPQSRQITRDRMAKMLEIYQGNLTSVTSVPELTTSANKIKDWRAKVLEENGASTALMNEMVTILTEIETTMNSKISTVTDRQQQITMQRLSTQTAKMKEVMQAMAPYGDRLKAALNG